MEKEKYIQDLADIKNMMEKSSRFLSLSGKSGIIAGSTALIAAWAAWEILYNQAPYFTREMIQVLPKLEIIKLAIIALATLIISLSFGYYLTQKIAKKEGRPMWDQTAKQLVVNLAIPLVAGGVFLLILLLKGLVGIVAPGTLIFYGLALVNASKYTVTDIRFLGFAEIIVGLFATYFIGYGLFFWAFGFGVLHIIYGVWMHIKYQQGN